MKNKAKLLASSHSLEGIKKLIAEYFCQKDIELTFGSIGLWHIDGKSKNYQVMKTKYRYRFELSDSFLPEGTTVFNIGE